MSRHQANHYIKTNLAAMKKHGYRVVKELGRGGYGIVYKAQHSSNDQDIWAIKINFNTISRDNIYVQIALLNNMQSLDRLALLKEAFVEKNVYYIVLEYFPASSYINYFSTLAYTDVKHYIYELLIAIKQLKSIGVYHRDIKPANFLYNLEAKRGVLVDYGLAELDPKYLQELEDKFQKFQDEDIDDLDQQEYLEYKRIKKQLEPYRVINECLSSIGRNKVGTESFVPLETIMEVPNQSYSSDMWPVGVIFLQFVSRRYTIFSNLHIALEDQRKSKKSSYHISFILELAAIFGVEPVKQQLKQWGFEVDFPDIKMYPLASLIEIEQFDDDGMDFLTRVLDLNPERRLTVEEALAHPLFRQIAGEHSLQ